MERTSLNRLPSPTFRYLHTNDTKVIFTPPRVSAKAVFSESGFVCKGAEFPKEFEGASEETAAAALAGESYTIRIPDGTEARLEITVMADDMHPDYAGAFRFLLGKRSGLDLVWRCGGGRTGSGCMASCYELEEGARLHISGIQIFGTEFFSCHQRYYMLGTDAEAECSMAELGAAEAIVHSRGELRGDRASLREGIVYAGIDRQHLDLFCHINHYGKKTISHIEAKGSLADQSSKTFRGTIDFRRGCAGAVGNEEDYAILLSPKARNISLPLLLCTEDDVVGNHAASAGQLNEGQIYYLMSRGFTWEEARRVAVESMIRPLIDRLDDTVKSPALEEIRRRFDGRSAEK